jgi:hypothetical protein
MGVTHTHCCSADRAVERWCIIANTIALVEMNGRHTHTHTHRVCLEVLWQRGISNIPPPPCYAVSRMPGDGLWGAVGHTNMQCVSCCLVVGYEGRSRGVLAAFVHIAQLACEGCPPAGPNTELMVCSSGRTIGLLNLAV